MSHDWLSNTKHFRDIINSLLDIQLLNIMDVFENRLATCFPAEKLLVSIKKKSTKRRVLI